MFDLPSRMPFGNSLLHLAGGALHFLLGYALFAAIDARSVTIGCFFGLTFAAGHLMHASWSSATTRGFGSNGCRRRNAIVETRDA